MRRLITAEDRTEVVNTNVTLHHFSLDTSHDDQEENYQLLHGLNSQDTNKHSRALIRGRDSIVIRALIRIRYAETITTVSETLDFIYILWFYNEFINFSHLTRIQLLLVRYTQ